jgi:hypothetical protein
MAFEWHADLFTYEGVNLVNTDMQSSQYLFVTPQQHGGRGLLSNGSGMRVGMSSKGGRGRCFTVAQWHSILATQQQKEKGTCVGRTNCTHIA